MENDIHDEISGEELHELLGRHVAMLMEHFEAVQIVATNSGGGVTASYFLGDGNLFARVGLAREWAMKQDTYSRVQARREAESGDDD